jgi:hypothetical protein
MKIVQTNLFCQNATLKCFLWKNFNGKKPPLGLEKVAFVQMGLFGGCSLKNAINFGKLWVWLVIVDKWSLFAFIN